MNDCLSNPSVVLRMNIYPHHAERHITLLFRYCPDMPEVSRMVHPANFWVRIRSIKSLCPLCVLRCAPNLVHIPANDASLYKLDNNSCLGGCSSPARRPEHRIEAGILEPSHPYVPPCIRHFLIVMPQAPHKPPVGYGWHSPCTLS